MFIKNFKNVAENLVPGIFSVLKNTLQNKIWENLHAEFGIL